MNCDTSKQGYMSSRPDLSADEGVSGRGNSTGFRRFSGDRFQPLHRVRQMREKMPYEGNGQIEGDNR